MSTGPWKSKISHHARMLGRMKSARKTESSRQNGRLSKGMPLSDALCAACGRQLGVINRSGYCSNLDCRKAMRRARNST